MKSKRVIVVGGGAVGVELVGEIKTDFPSKEVLTVYMMLPLKYLFF